MGAAAYGAGYLHGVRDRLLGDSEGLHWGMEHAASSAWWLGYEAGLEAAPQDYRLFRSPRRLRVSFVRGRCGKIGGKEGRDVRG